MPINDVKDCPTKVNLDFVGNNVGKRGNLNLDLNVDLHGSKKIKLTLLMLAPVFFVLMHVYSYMAPVLHDMHAAGC